MIFHEQNLQRDRPVGLTRMAMDLGIWELLRFVSKDYSQLDQGFNPILQPCFSGSFGLIGRAIGRVVYRILASEAVLEPALTGG